ncbi:hypothetical protein [Clostridium sp.]|uniref:hypothetical protein n=1 Tax=Clostridium sp. TaxID=1506 RepID=UPI001A55309A|nr:hypothetical protein [Clostridium sp.]MBK5237420.1 hypothetical protein [Clostridium sp.]
MNRTIVCRECDNNRVTIEKIGQQLYIKCSKCGITIMKAVHLESWMENVDNLYKFRVNIDNTYKFRMNIDDDSLFDAVIVKREINKKESETLRKEETKIRLLYVKEYGYIRQIDEDEYVEISKAITREDRVRTSVVRTSS